MSETKIKCEVKNSRTCIVWAELTVGAVLTRMVVAAVGVAGLCVMLVTAWLCCVLA